MTQYNTLNVKLSNSQLNKLKYVLKNGTENKFFFIETNFPHKLLSNDTQVSKVFKAFANSSIVNVKCIFLFTHFRVNLNSARNRRETRTHNHLVRKGTLNHLSKLLIAK